MKYCKYILFVLFFLSIKYSNSQSGIDTMYIYPNSFCDSATIQFYNSIHDTVSLELYSRWGEIKKSFLRDSLLALGKYTFVLHGDSLPNNAYILIVQHSSSKGKSYWVVKNCNTTTGIKYNKFENKICAFPNPTNSNFTIQYFSQQNEVFTIYNMFGGVIYKDAWKTEETQKIIDCSGFAKGIYIIRLATETSKIVIQ